MSTYTFYFDESMHDKMIGLTDNSEFNFMKNAANDVYVGAFWGARTKRIIHISDALMDFERKQKQRYGLSDTHELKTTIINKKNFKYGFRSFNHDCYCFYNELFDLIHELKLEIHTTIISKMELYLRNLFGSYDIDMHCVIPDFFYYSITKFMLVYRKI